MQARQDPLRLLGGRWVRPEIVVVLDTSDSMSRSLAGALAGSSRLALAKRALRSVVTEFREAASFGLVTFRQRGYFRYEEASPVDATVREIWLPEWVLRSRGSWTQGLGWRHEGDRPRRSFRLGAALPARRGVTYTLVEGAPSRGDSLYRGEIAGAPKSQTQRPRTKIVYRRANWAPWGRVFDDGRVRWRYQGSYYTHPAPRAKTPRRATTLPAYRGPVLWIGDQLYRYPGGAEGAAISGFTGGEIIVGLAQAAGPRPQATFDHALGRLLDRLAEPANGGLVASGGTPTPDALATAREHFAARESADPHAACRSRFVLLLSDGESGRASAAQNEALNLFELHGVQTIGVAVPGTTAGGRAELDAIADCGDDGDCQDRSARSLSVASERALIDALRDIVYRATRGDYATAPAGVTTSAQGRAGDVSITPSVQFPGWRGRLQATDLRRDPARKLWEAGALLQGRAFSERKVYSGRPTREAGKPFRVYDGQAINGAMAALWPRAAGAVPADLTQAIAWALGKHRRWKLPPIVRAVPAAVGPPPSYRGRADHAAFAARHARRQRLVYVASNEGILHAFDAHSGQEVWGYLIPHLLPKLYALYKAGGQSADPSKFMYVLASSPRVEDVKIDGVWKTVLVQTDGPGGQDFVVLDITAMPSCEPERPAVCKGAPAPRILFDSADAQGDPALGKRLLVELAKRQHIALAPAMLRHDPRKNYLALASGANQAESSSPSAVSRLQVYLDDGQTSPLGRADTLVDCSISNICSCLGAEAGVICMSPSARAKPVGSPLLAHAAKGRAVASFVYYDPPPQSCGGDPACQRDADCGSGQSCQARRCKTPCAVATVQIDCPAGTTCRAGFCAGPGRGDSYVFRIALDAHTRPPTARLANAVKLVGVQASGLTVIGGGIVALSACGRDATPAGLQALGSGSLATSLAALGQAAIESWRELR